jgi:methionine-S-sulfoxide reductase
MHIISTLCIISYFVGTLMNADAFNHPVKSFRSSVAMFGSVGNEPNACIIGFISPNDAEELAHVLKRVGFKNVFVGEVGSEKSIYKYQYIKASGMLKLVPDTNNEDTRAPRWVPIQKGEENVLVANGWSFLDPDESEPISAFDIDAANIEGKYVPKWTIDNKADDCFSLSTLGFDLCRMSREQILEESLSVTAQAKMSLLEGSTDKPNVKTTNNGCDLTGSVYNIRPGVFTCAIGGLPLFTTADLRPTTASSGWLSFSRPINESHITHIEPAKESTDRRVEVVCAKTGCHLGHYFGSDGYCINASCLNFLGFSSDEKIQFLHPTSWLRLRLEDTLLNPSERILKDFLTKHIKVEEVFLGAGCFWHVEFALRRLPGVIDTRCCYAGGSTRFPTYKSVCEGQTGHAEVVQVVFDPKTCEPQKLFDCFLTMHDPTSVRAHGKRAQGTGQYRSGIFVKEENEDLELIANQCVSDCSKELSKMIITEVRRIPFGSWWDAESKHQQHDERVKKLSGNQIETLSQKSWLMEYGRRSTSIWGSSITIHPIDDDGDDGMAQIMI